MKEIFDVSVVMLAYNHEKYIRKAIDSVLGQKFDGRMEILIGEDCSTDSTRGIIEEYCKKFPSLIFPVFQNSNVGATKNQFSILKKARGQYLAFLECDDFWTNEYKIKYQVDFLRFNSEYAAVYHNYTVVDKDDKLIEKSDSTYADIEYGVRDFEMGIFPSHTATCMCRNFFNEESCEILFKGHSLINDRTWILLFLEHGKIKVLNEYMSSYRKIISMNAGNAWSLQLKNNMYLEQWNYYYILEKYAREHNLGLDMCYLKMITFIQAFNRLLKSRSRHDFKIMKSIYGKSEFKMLYSYFLVRVTIEQLKYKLFHRGKRTALEMYFCDRRNKNGT